MVCEFPELQGIMGMEYARFENLPEEMAYAIGEHYRPRTADDNPPETPIGIVLSLADKTDTIVGAFGVDLVPTGSSDPYALRRQAIGIIRTLIDREIHLSLVWLNRQSAEGYDEQFADRTEEILKAVGEFFRDRVQTVFGDQEVPYDILRACMRTSWENPYDLSLRAKALVQSSKESYWPELVAAVERTYNITRSLEVMCPVKKKLLSEPEEKELHRLYQGNKANITALLEKRQYLEVCRIYHQTFSEPIHMFFDKVFVNVDDEEIRNNRLSLLKLINLLFSTHLADLSEMLQGES